MPVEQRGETNVQISRLCKCNELIPKSQVAADFDRKLETVNSVESHSVYPVEDHPEGIPRAERDGDRWEATMGGIAGIIVTQFASLRRGPNYL